LKSLDCKDTIFLGKDKRNISFFENLIIYTGKHQGVWGRVAPQIWLKVKKETNYSLLTLFILKIK